jgi:DNA-binding transcriptional MocR family regulator
LSLAGGYPDASMRHDERVAVALARAARRPGAWEPTPMMGIPELRGWFAREFGVDQDDVLITPGVQAALSATMRAILPAGSPVLFAVPTYPGALAVARSAGLIPVPVPTDPEGVRTELLERAFAATGARLLYLQPTFANPDGQVLASTRRQEVLALAGKAGAFIIEDDWARWLSHAGPAPPPLIRDDDHGHVITLASLTKTTAPSLRVGAVSARGPVLQRVAAMRMVDDFFMCRPLQEAAVELVTSTHWERQLKAVAATLRDRLHHLIRALATDLPDCGYAKPQGGLSLWLQLPQGSDDSIIAEKALANGVSVLPGRLFSIGEPGHPHLRVAYASLDSSRIAEAVHRLGDAVKLVQSNNDSR